MFQQGLTDTLSATEIRQSIDQTQERTKRSTAGSSAHGFSCSRRLSPLSGRNSTYRLVQISGTGSQLVRLVGLTLADAFHFGGMQAVDLGAALPAFLLANPPAKAEQVSESGLKPIIAVDLAGDVADDAAEIGLERAQSPVGALELLGMGVTLMLDQGELADPPIRLP